MLQDLNDFIAAHSSVSDSYIDRGLDLINIKRGRVGPLFVGWLFLIFVFHLAAFFISPISFFTSRNISSIAFAILFSSSVSAVIIFLSISSYHLWDRLSSLELAA